jgi:undecaprenyl-diphosphatase
VHRWAADLTAVGSTFVLTLAVTLVFTALLLAGHVRLAMFILITSLGASGLIISVKDMVERPRPPAGIRLDPFVGDSFSFPSGHALGAMAIYGNLGWLLVRLAPNQRTARFILAAALGLAIGIGLTRVYLRVHYPSDVLAGWLAGLAWMAVTIVAVRLIPAAGSSPAGNTARPVESL